MHPLVKHALKFSFISCVLVLLGAAVISALSGADFYLQMRSALFGCAVFFLVNNGFYFSAFFIPEKLLTAGLVLYRAIYSYVLKYLILCVLFYLCLHFKLVLPLTFILCFIAALCLHLVISLTQPAKL